MIEIARKAKVSTGTVCKVLNGHSSVSSQLSSRVYKVAQELGYEHRKKRRGKSNAAINTGYMGLLCVGLPEETVKLPFMLTFASYLESQLSNQGMQMVWVQVPDPEVLPDNVNPARMDGGFVIGYPGAKMLPGLHRLRAVGVFGCPHAGLDWVTTNAAEHGRRAGEYLLERGHRRLAFLCTDKHHDVFAEYGRAFKNTVDAHGVEAMMLVSQKEYSFRYFMTQRDIREIVRELLQAGYFALSAEKRPTGMYIANDEIAMITYQVLAEHGVNPGTDIEIISNDNNEPFLAALEPRPATIEPNYMEITRRAVEKLLYRIQYPNAPIGAQLLVPPRLVSPNPAVDERTR